jgi:hypothetical protein
MIGTWVGLRYYLAHDYMHATEENRASVDLDPNFPAAHLVLGENYIQVGLRNKAIDELQWAANLSGGSPLYTARWGLPLQLQTGIATHSEWPTNWR